MAVSKVPTSTSLVVQVENGLDSKGNTVYRNMSFSNIRTSVDIEKAHAVAVAISNALECPAGNINLKENSQLIQG